MKEKRIKVLLIEASAEYFQMVEKILAEARGVIFDLEYTDELTSGLKMIGSKGIDVLLLDISFCDVPELLTISEVQVQIPTLPIIILSEQDDEELALKCIQRGADDYLVKERLNVNLLERSIRYAFERKTTRKVLENMNQELAERVKELNCLYAISEAIEGQDVLKEEVLEIVVDLIPTGWQYPEIACSRITLDNLEIKTQNFKETIWKQSSDIIVQGKRMGKVDVCYLEEKPECFEGPFQNEERTLIFIIAERLGEAIEIKKANEALRQTNEAFKMSNRELENFAYIISHDLKEPLRMITTYLQFLELRYKGKLDSDADEFIGFAVDGATRMHALIDDLLTYSRVATLGKVFEPVDSKEVFDLALENLQVAIKESNALITHDPLPTVFADDIQVGQLYQNLIGNAIKFHGDKPPRVHVSAEQKENEWLFSVRDNGIGIDSKYAENIFLAFQRLHKKSEYPGTGLGLAISKKIVERFGGRIWVESGPNRGSTFYFTIPKRGGEQPENFTNG